MMEGSILGNRYELLEKIGGGGMALVYKAHCRLLNRYVAVKILRPEYTNDEEFVKRFLIEAQSVARLSHPNIVPIYDVGNEAGMHYIVMEYVQGTTLKEFINRKGLLKWSDAVNISIQICSAIEHAHRNHIVHRDIKPQNIIITNDGIAKVTDFGIARAVSTSTITMTGNTVGSVHYFSPEQARGGYIGEKSDIYSMGICLYEMITGKLPFDGESPVAVALKHIQEQPVQPIDINPSIPKSLNDLVMKAIRKEQDSRYQNATAMLQDLYKISRNPSGTVIMDESSDNGATRRVSALTDEDINENVNAIGLKDNNMKKSKLDKKTIGIAVATCAVIVISFIVLMVMLISPNNNKNGYEIQNYVGMDYQKVKSDLESNKITVKITRKDDDKADKDIITAQSVDAGKTLKSGGFIELTVSNGAKMVKIPDLTKSDYRQAETKLKDLDLSVKFEDEFHESIPENFVTRTDPAKDAEVKAGSTVVVYKSKGPEIKDTKVPRLIGLTKQQAMQALAQANLKVGTISPDDTSIAVGKVISQVPVEGTTVKEQSAVNITLETPVATPTPTPVPNKTIAESISLKSGNKYGDTIKVRVEVQLPGSTSTNVIFNDTKNKTDFPITVNIPVIDNGKTKVNVYLDDKLYDSFSRP